MNKSPQDSQQVETEQRKPEVEESICQNLEIGHLFLKTLVPSTESLRRKTYIQNIYKNIYSNICF